MRSASLLVSSSAGSDGVPGFVEGAPREDELEAPDGPIVFVDPVTAGLISNALDPKHKRPVPCTLVLPGVGAPAYP